MNIISIDYGKYKSGIFMIVDGQEKSYKIINKQGCSDSLAFYNIYDQLNDILMQNDIDYALIEKCTLNRVNAKSITLMPAIMGILKLTFQIFGIPVIDSINASMWKSLTVGKIDKKSKLYRDKVKEKYGKEFEIIDQIDAFLIYKASREILKRKTLTTAQRKVKEQLLEVENEINNLH